ncbi:4Fe-4S single cluster domain-containing protein, partial [Pradoshia sp.]
NEMTIEAIYEEVMSNPLTDVTFSGGEPFLQADELQVLAMRLKQSGKNIWIYSGYTLGQLMNHSNPAIQNVLNYCDVLVDGRFELDKKESNLLFRGSSNQKIIHLQTSGRSEKDTR